MTTRRRFLVLAGGALASAAAEAQLPPNIEALRKAGRTEEADAELARFEAAYPGWLKQKGLRKP